MAIATISNGDLGEIVRVNKLNEAIASVNQGIVTPNTVWVNSESDLPSAVSGVITGAASTTYILGTSLLSTANEFRFSPGTKLMSLNRGANFWNYTGTGSAFSWATGGGIFQMEDIGIIATSGSVFNLVGDGTETLIITNCFIFNCVSVGTIDGVRSTVCRSFSVVNASDTTNGGLIIKSTTVGLTEEFTMSNSFWNDGILNGIMIDFQAANMERIQLSTGNRFLTASGVTAIKGLANSTNFLSTEIGGLITGTIFSGLGTALENITTSDIKWDLDAKGIASTSVLGRATLITNTTETVITTANTYVKIAGTWDIQDASRFTVDSTGRITYIGDEPLLGVDCRAEGSIEPSGTNNRLCNTRIAKNGDATTTESIATQGGSFADQNDPIGVTSSGLFDLVTNDYLEVFATNADGTENVIYSNGKFTVRSM